MVKSSKSSKSSAPVAVQQIDTPAIEQVKVETPVAEQTAVEPKAKAKKYAPTGEVIDTAVLTVVKSNPKRAGSKSFERYARFYQVGLTVAQVIAAYKSANQGPLARLDLRWDLQHGHIELGMPQG